MTRNAGRSRGGAAVTMVMMIVLAVLPLVFGAVTSMFQSLRSAIQGRNMKSSRVIATASLSDFMRTFSVDYNRDYFETIFLVRKAPDFAGIGQSSSTWTLDPLRKTIAISSRGVYRKTGTGNRMVFEKGIEAVFAFRSDLTRFGLYWDADTVDLSDPGQFHSNFCANWTFSGSVWSHENLDTGGCNVTFRDGVLVVPGTFTVRTGATLGPSLKVFCGTLDVVGTPNVGGADITESPRDRIPGEPTNPYKNNPSWGGLVIDEVNPGRDLGYYRTRNSTRTVASAELTVTFQPDGTVSIFNHDTGLADAFPAPEDKLTLVLDGSSVTVKGVITRPTTVVSLSGGAPDGGRVTVEGDLLYAGGATVASPTGSLALLAERSLTFSSPAGVAQDVAGFFWAGEGVAIPTKHFLHVHGSLFGFPNDVALTYTPTTDLQITPDGNLFLYYPPYMPKKPTVVSWDYVG